MLKMVQGILLKREIHCKSASCLLYGSLLRGLFPTTFPSYGTRDDFRGLFCFFFCFC